MRPVIVIGAGMGGLCAAIRLAAAGLPVLVLERGPRPGGKAGIAVVDGVEVDTGPSVLTLPDVFDGVLRTAGLRLRDVVELTLPEPACRYVWPAGDVVDVFSDVGLTVRSVRASLGERAATEVAAFMNDSRRIWEAAAPWFVLGAAPSVGRVLRLGPEAWADVRRIDAFRTMDRHIRARCTSPELVALLQRYATYNGSDPRRAPATLDCIAHVELGLGVHGVVGGIYALVRALVAVAERLGVVIACERGVARVVLHEGNVTGVETEDGVVHAASAVVANADTSHVVADLLPRDARHRLSPKQIPSTSGWVGILKARRRPGRTGHTVLFPARPYHEEFVDLFDRDRPPTEPTVYLCAQERCHRRAGWHEHEPLFVMANAPAEPPDGTRPPATWTALRDTVLARLRHADLIDTDDALLWERSPRGLAQQFPGSRGALYGAASNDLFAAFRRPPNRVAGIPGLYLASGSAHPGGGMPLCAQSGRAAAEALLADLRR